MNIAIDIDDTLTDTFDYFIPYLAEFLHVDSEDLWRRNISYTTLPDEWKDQGLAFGKAYYDTIAPNVPFKPDAAQAVQTLRALGHRIVIITKRTTRTYTDPYQTTADTLHRAGIVYDKLICTRDKAASCLEENIDLMIDDLAVNCDAVAAAGIPVLMFSSKENRTRPTVYPRAENWTEAVEFVRQMDAKAASNV